MHRTAPTDGAAFFRYTTEFKRGLSFRHSIDQLSAQIQLVNTQNDARYPQAVEHS